MKYPYPIMVNLAGRQCLVIGGGPIAERKVFSLLEAGARVTLISMEFTERLAELANNSEVVLHRQTFHPSMMTSDELIPFTLVVAATNSAEINAQVYEFATAQGKLVNVVDQPELSSYIQPSVVRRGKLVIAVSTGELVHQQLVESLGNWITIMVRNTPFIWISSAKCVVSCKVK